MISTPSIPPCARVAVIQDGARLHYAIPLALQQRNMLHRVYTDWYSCPGSLERSVGRFLGLLRPLLGRRILERYHPDLDPRLVWRNPLLKLVATALRPTFRSAEGYYDWEARIVGRWLRAHAPTGADAVFGFIRNVSPEVWDCFRRIGLVTVGNQMCNPALVERELLTRERNRWPEWAYGDAPPTFELLESIERETWGALDLVVCPSDFVQAGVMAQGVSGRRAVVIPYPYEPAATAPPDRRYRSRPVRVVYVGRVSLSKGAPYFFEVARRFDPRNVRFVMIGPVQLPAAAAKVVPPSVELIGSVSRSEVFGQLGLGDIFFFPAVSEGSAGAVMEAMASGLPVVTSPNSGSVARDGDEGFVRPYDDVDGFAGAIDRLTANPGLRVQMGAAARARAQMYNLDMFSRQLEACLTGLLHSASQRELSI
jgi:glycosyltransferase involved in cell wall biosynthesis